MKINSWKVERFVWILSLTLGPVAYFVLLITLPGAPNIGIIRKDLIGLVVTFAICWAAGFILVWAMH